MGTPRESTPETAASVTVFVGDDGAISQPDTFRFCPLGAQLYTRREMEECSILEFKLDLPDGTAPASQIACSGVVVNCQPNDSGSMYRVWIKFLDLPDSARENIKCFAKSSEFLCPFCENY